MCVWLLQHIVHSRESPPGGRADLRHPPSYSPPPPSTSPTTFTQLPVAGLGHTDKTAQLIALQDQCPWGTLQRLRLCVSFGALEYIKLFPCFSVSEPRA